MTEEDIYIRVDEPDTVFTEEEKKKVWENTKHYQDNWKKYSKSIF